MPDHWPEYGDCWDWTAARRRRQDGALSYGYLKNRGAPDMPAHHAAWELAGGSPIPDTWEIGHTCDRTGCVRNDTVGAYLVDGISYERRGHLWLATHRANMADCAAKQRTGMQLHPDIRRPGELNPVAKLTEVAVRDILTRYAARTASQGELAVEYGVNDSAISMIVRGRRWQTIAPEIPRIDRRQRVGPR